MIYFLFGTESVKVRERFHEVLESLKKKRPEAEIFKMDAETFSPAQLEEFIGGMGLFEKKYIVLFDRIFENKEALALVSEKLKELAEAENMFLILEGKVDKKTLSKIEKHAYKIEEFSTDETLKKKESFNIFSLTDALGKRDRKSLWMLYQKARSTDAEDEEVCGILFWQVKAMLLAGELGVKDSGLNPFVHKKSEGYARNFSKKELQKMSSELVTLYHDAHRGMHDFDLALERFILQV